ncbi:carbon-nitrogen hydrolase family protein [Anaeromicrobium sediminis]|uniref:Carbon-nitrogen hydrolase family protein n=1 Tax=Anaeromicrobium sediminis TaxID=1478221 RepID=A0A267MDB4_9FIRM|nr:carbon-nitrogen hydrolase family protein [Anaeromicrobium sediminis]PAB57372.1 carbon-nitrogen hydrolase family protein [Anaeromicrobium sediminis]
MKEHVACCIQMAIEPNKIKQNIDKCCEWIIRAKKEYDCELVVLPESITTGFTPNMEVMEFYEMLDFVPGRDTKKIQQLARELKIHINFPLYEKGKNPGEILNSSLLIDDNGDILGNYRKTHPFPTERIEGGGWTTPGNEVVVVDTKLGKIGLIICYDGDFPELSRMLALKGAEIITRPAALLRSFEIWEFVNKARAYDNHVYLLAANSIGADAGGTHYFGHSMIVNPIGQTIALGRGCEEIIGVKLDPNPIKHVTYGCNSPMIFDHLEDRNVGVYEGILTEGRSAFEPAKRIPYKRGI